MSDHYDSSIPVLSVPFHWKGEKLTSQSKVISLGSCFSENLPYLLAGGGVEVAANANGILYNPFSIRDALERAVEDLPYKEEEFFFHNGLFHSFSHHGSFSAPTAALGVEKAERKRRELIKFLPEADLFLVTLSTAIVFTRGEEKRIVANCHKFPNGEFTRRCLTFEETLFAIKEIVTLFRKVNKNAPILFSLSPVRHNPGDPVRENYSKSLLRCAVEEVLSGEDKVFYFPAYEILRDELRSYRFYKEDMLHPSELAVKIILSRFRKEVCHKELEEKILLFEKEEKFLKHIPKNEKEGEK